MTDIVKIILIIPMFLFRMIGRKTKRDPHKMIFGAWFGHKYDDNSKALFEYTVRTRKDIKACWITKSKKVQSELLRLNYPVCYVWSFRAFYYHLYAKYVVYCTSSQDASSVLSYPLLSGALFVNLWHGIPLKKIGKDDDISREHFNKMLEEKSVFCRKALKIYYSLRLNHSNNVYVFSSSEAISKIYEGVFGLSKEKILCMGQARNDYFYNEHSNIFRKRYPDKKIVVYMPTHRNEGKTKMDFHDLLNLNELNDILKANNCVLLMKKHFFHNSDPIVEESEYSNIFELTHEDVKAQELIDAGDILITDYSSTYIDYLLLNRPIIFYAYDLDNYLKEDRKLYLEYNKDNIPGTICKTKLSLENELKDIIQGNDSNEALRHKIRDYYYSIDNQKAVASKQLDKILTLE